MIPPSTRPPRARRGSRWISLHLEHPTNTIVVRYAMPDAPGGGIAATLGLYINGVRKQSLALTSRFAWLYGGEADSSNNSPGSGAHHFFGELATWGGDDPGCPAEA